MFKPESSFNKPSIRLCDQFQWNLFRKNNEKYIAIYYVKVYYFKSMVKLLVYTIIAYLWINVILEVGKLKTAEHWSIISSQNWLEIKCLGVVPVPKKSTIHKGKNNVEVYLQYITNRY